MCLFIREKEPRIAKRDIVVLKYLEKDLEYFFSPCRRTFVILGEVLEAHPKGAQISYHSMDNYNREISKLEGGAIHAMLFENPYYGN